MPLNGRNDEIFTLPFFPNNAGEFEFLGDPGLRRRFLGATKYSASDTSEELAKRLRKLNALDKLIEEIRKQNEEIRARNESIRKKRIEDANDIDKKLEAIKKYYKQVEDAELRPQRMREQAAREVDELLKPKVKGLSEAFRVGPGYAVGKTTADILGQSPHVAESVRKMLPTYGSPRVMVEPSPFFDDKYDVYIGEGYNVHKRSVPKKTSKELLADAIQKARRRADLRDINRGNYNLSEFAENIGGQDFYKAETGGNEYKVGIQRGTRNLLVIDKDGRITMIGAEPVSDEEKRKMYLDQGRRQADARLRRQASQAISSAIKYRNPGLIDVAIARRPELAEYINEAASNLARRSPSHFEHMRELEKIQRELANELEKMQKGSLLGREESELLHKHEMEKMREGMTLPKLEHTQELERMQKEYANELDKLRKAFDMEREKLQIQHRNELEKLREEEKHRKERFELYLKALQQMGSNNKKLPDPTAVPGF